MSVIALEHHLEKERNGEYPLELVAVQYDGPKSSLSVGNALTAQGGWPGTGILNNGVWYFALVPDDGRLAYLENRNDLNIVYPDDQERFAELLLDKPRLPSNVFDRGADRDLQERFFDALGLKPTVEGGPLREQLEAMAPDGAVDADEDMTDQSRVKELAEQPRDALKEAVKEVREDADEFSLRGAGKTDMAEFLADQDAGEVNDALDGADSEDDADEEG